MLRHGKIKCPAHVSDNCPICLGTGMAKVTWWDETLEDEVREFDEYMEKRRMGRWVSALYGLHGTKR